MKKLLYFFSLFFLASCTSNTIFKAPKDLIPKDTMSLLIQDLMVAASSKFVKNKNLEKKINYMPLVYERFKIDSLRFQTSNLYYMSKIDLYQEIFLNAKTSLKKQEEDLNYIVKIKDSLREDSIKKLKSFDLDKKLPKKLKEDFNDR